MRVGSDEKNGNCCESPQRGCEAPEEGVQKGVSPSLLQKNFVIANPLECIKGIFSCSLTVQIMTF